MTVYKLIIPSDNSENLGSELFPEVGGTRIIDYDSIDETVEMAKILSKKGVDTILWCINRDAGKE